MRQYLFDWRSARPSRAELAGRAVRRRGTPETFPSGVDLGFFRRDETRRNFRRGVRSSGGRRQRAGSREGVTSSVPGHAAGSGPGADAAQRRGADPGVDPRAPAEAAFRRWLAQATAGVKVEGARGACCKTGRGETVRRTGAIIAAVGAALLLSRGRRSPRDRRRRRAGERGAGHFFRRCASRCRKGWGSPWATRMRSCARARPPRGAALDRGPLVDSVLVRKEAEKLGQPIAEGEIDKAVESVRKANGMSEAQFAELLGKEGISLPAYRRRLRWQMERSDRPGAQVQGGHGDGKRGARLLPGERGTVPRWGRRSGSRRSSSRSPPRSPRRRRRAGADRRAAGGRGGPGGTHLRRGAGVGSRNVSLSIHAADFVTTEDLLPEPAAGSSPSAGRESSSPFFAEAGAYLLRVVERRGDARGFLRGEGRFDRGLTDRRSEKAYSDLLSELKRSASIDVRL